MCLMKHFLYGNMFPLKQHIIMFIFAQQMVGELPAWTRLWCVMRQNTLRCWQYPEDVGRKMPMHTFNFTEVIKS